MTGSRNERLLTTAVNCFDILETLQARDGATASELSVALDISKSTLYGYLTTLHELEYVVKTDEEYDVSLKCLDHGTYAREKIPLIEHARSPLEHLATSTNQVAWLYVEEHGHLVYLLSAEGENAVRTRGRVGMRTHLHCTAAGKAILSHLPEARVREIIDRHGLPRLTDQTITEVDALFAALESVRERGYAFNVGESMENARAVAAPILVDDEPVGAVNVVGSASRLRGRGFREGMAEAVLGTANDIELNLRYR